MQTPQMSQFSSRQCRDTCVLTMTGEVYRESSGHWKKVVGQQCNTLSCSC